MGTDGSTGGVQASSLRGTTRVRSLLLGACRLHDLDAAEDELLLLTGSGGLQVTLMLLGLHVDPLRAARGHLTVGTIGRRSLREVLASGDGTRAAIIYATSPVSI